MNLINKTALVYDSVIRRVAREEEIALRNSDECVASVKAVRNGDESKKVYNYYRCPQATMPEGVDETTRCLENLIGNNKVLIDYDVHGDWERLWNMVKEQLLELGIIHFERSVRDGAHMMVRQIEGLTIEDTISWFEDKLGLEFDHKTKDISRACFLVPTSFVVYESDEYYADTVETQVQEIPDSLLQQTVETQTTTDSAETTSSVDDDIDSLIQELSNDTSDSWDDIEFDENGKLVITQTTTQNVSAAIEDEYHRQKESDYEEVDYIIQNFILPRKVDCTVTEPEWFSLACVIASIQGEDGREMFHAISRFHPEYDPQETDKKYDHVLRSGYSGYTLGTLIFQARKYGAIKPLDSATVTDSVTAVTNPDTTTN